MKTLITLNISKNEVTKKKYQIDIYMFLSPIIGIFEAVTGIVNKTKIALIIIAQAT
jgi:hypothetical protein